MHDTVTATSCTLHSTTQLEHSNKKRGQAADTRETGRKQRNKKGLHEYRKAKKAKKVGNAS